MIKKTIPFILLACFFSGGLFLYKNSSPSMMQNETVYIKQGSSITSAGRKLEEMNLIRDKDFFRALSYLYLRSRIRSGRYLVHRGMTSMEIFRRLASGDVITQRVTIPEGFNLYQIAARFETHEITAKGRFLYHAFDRSFLQGIGIRAHSAEGYLFPDTYVFPEASDPRDIILAMVKKMKRVLKEVEGASLEGKKIKTHRLLTLASLVEKEAKIPSERKLIASVFQNRLDRNWRMDCDPTVRYAVKKFKGKIYYRDLASDSPFNTYRHRGLPPTPICSPGKAAITAAAAPPRSEYLFFVARNDGSHYFSKTLRQHNRAVQHYQRGKKTGFKDDQLKSRR